MSGMSLCPAFRHCSRSLWHQFFGTIALMLKNPCQQLCSFSLAPCQRSYACPMGQSLETLAGLRRTVFRNNRIDEICPEKPRTNSRAFLASLPANEAKAMHVPSPDVCKPLEKSWAHSFSGQSNSWNLSWKPVPTALLRSTSLPCNGALPKLFPTVSPPSTLVVTSISLPPNGALPKLVPIAKLFPTVSPPTTLSSLPSRSFPTDIHPTVASVSLLPDGALPMLFPTVSLPSTLSSLPYTELSPSHFPRFPLRPACRHSRIAPSQRSSPQAISHGFPSVHPIVTSVFSPLPQGAAQPISHGFLSVHPVVASIYVPSQRTSPQPISHGFLSVHLVVASIRSLPTDLSPSYFPRFPFRPPSRHIRIAPSRQV